MAQTRIAVINFRPKGKKTPEPLRFIKVLQVSVPMEKFVVIATEDGTIAIREENVTLVAEQDVTLPEGQEVPGLVGPDGEPIAPSQATAPPTEVEHPVKGSEDPGAVPFPAPEETPQ